jgi:hypothetical protein
MENSLCIEFNLLKELFKAEPFEQLKHLISLQDKQVESYREEHAVHAEAVVGFIKAYPIEHSLHLVLSQATHSAPKGVEH